MKFYYAPGACSMGIHLLLEEAGCSFEAIRLSFAKEEQRSDGFLAVNPKGKVPVLDAGQDGVITEFPAIAFYVASLDPASRLLPGDTMAQVRALELIDHAIATVHMRGFTRLSRPEVFSSDGDPEKVRAAGRTIVGDGLAWMDARLGDAPYALGAFSIADAALFILEWWARRSGLPLPERLSAHLDRMLDRPAVQRMLATEGLAAAA
ncbi:glutathione S-transferase family protein [Variovorax ginsengisoli]|uniref:Glutathione S-transferase N-terminal domain-containing protein n=1 Tax=Variovorax ginsengisoli TaxID=363844 RepID=A0ABT8SCM3_9BURK|nr:glutathione S-transferase C-terminal domain-containing protein [Variovorax ginsengisoli]MDN8617495.1 glutathione S-transferase N-terminal domain-containing protein [Variovorax ginsengisoli]MDO1536665.1 glutathione S-transferase N-terminal domain-containing protein [Variovorax ginsengisoli]